MKKCDISEKCGSCQLLHLNYEDTLEFKKRYVNECFKKEKINYVVNKIIPADKTFGYRNKMQVGFKKQNNTLIYGFYEENSHRIVPMNKCLMHSDIQNEIVNFFSSLMIKYHINSYDEDSQRGLIRYLLVKEAIKTNQIMIVIVTSSDVFPGRSNIVKELKSRFKEIKTIVQNINPRKTSIILGEKERILFGEGFITDTLCGINFNLTSKSFYQVNPLQTEKLYGVVKNYCISSKNDVLIDAYSGVGTIGMILSKNVKNVLSVESNEQATKAAIINSKNNNIRNVRFINDDATLFIKELACNREKIDIVVMDPPRTGSTIDFLSAVKQLKPKIVIYVSCEASTLARDLKELINDYHIKDITLVDMFCWTKHVESVVLLEHKNNQHVNLDKNRYMTREDIDMLRERNNKKNNLKAEQNRNICDRHWDGA